MKTLGYVLATLAVGLLRLAGRVLAAAGKAALLLATPLAAWLLYRLQRTGGTRSPQPVPEAPAAPALPSHATANAAVAVLPCSVPPMFDIADRIISLRLDPPVGVIHLRLYQARGLVRRELVVTEPCLRSLLKGRRHFLDNVPYEPAAGMEAVKDQAVQAAEVFINERGKRPARPRPAREGNSGNKKPLPASALAGQSEVQQVPPTMVPTVAAASQPAAALVAPAGGKDFTYVGVLVKAGTQTVTPEGRTPYEIYEATLRLDNGAELALRGAELQRELRASGCAVGQRIAITPMGKVPVVLANGSQGQKNLYRVQSVGAVPAVKQESAA
ncbi:MAG TPA: hypothetical protein VHL79_01085 [Ramlibacter sp.]|nr:hypothetical protein [Ramlibacter sp.]